VETRIQILRGRDPRFCIHLRRDIHAVHDGDGRTIGLDVQACDDEEGKRRQAARPCFCLTAGIPGGNLGASGYGGERESRRECRLGDDAEADATRPQQALGTRIDRIEEGHWAS
jgi:hypothetical protein